MSASTSPYLRRALANQALANQAQPSMRPPTLQGPPCEAEKQRSQSAPTSPVTPPWTPPRRRRVASAEPGPTSWLDVHIAVDVIKGADGRSELHCYVQAWDHTAHFAVSMRRLLFWMVSLLLLLPASAFQLMPRMPTMATTALAGSPVLAMPMRLSRLDNITSLDHRLPLGAAATSAATSAATLLADEEMPTVESQADNLMEEFEACFLDAGSDDDFTACLQQVHMSSLDELSSVIVKEGCNLIASKDDGTVVSLLGHVLHTVKSEGLEALELMSLRRLALRACVSASLHKLTVCALPAVSSCMLHVAPDVVHALNALAN